MIKLFVTASALASFAIAALFAAAGPGVRFGLWDYGTGLSLFRNFGLASVVVAAVAIAALVLALVKARRFLPLTALAAVASIGAASVPLQLRSAVEANPVIHDITTDFENPPEISAGAGAERTNPAAYLGSEPTGRASDGPSVAEAQRKAFPDIAPLDVSASMDDVRKAARAIVEEMGMSVLAEGPVSADSGAGWRIEAVSTSRWFGFKDDFVVRLSRLDDDATRIDVRSKSRVGKSDLGANAKRVRDFMARTRAQFVAGA